MRRIAPFSVAVWAALSAAPSAWACSVCWGSPEAPVVHGAELSILFLGGLTYALMVAGGVMFIAARRRRTQDRHDPSQTA